MHSPFLNLKKDIRRRRCLKRRKESQTCELRIHTKKKKKLKKKVSGLNGQLTSRELNSQLTSTELCKLQQLRITKMNALVQSEVNYTEELRA